MEEEYDPDAAVEVTLEYRSAEDELIRYAKIITARQLGELINALEELEECAEDMPLVTPRPGG